MLKQRIITALILIPIFVALILKLSPQYFIYLMTALVLLAAWEWSSLMGIKSLLLRLCYPVLMFGFISFPLFVPTEFVLLVGLAWWSMALVLVLLYPTGSPLWGKGVVWRGIMGFFVFIPAWRALNYIHDTDLFGEGRGPYMLLFLFVLIWTADIAAYFVGKKWGKQKLAREVSPGKSIEGLIGALIATALLSPALRCLFPKPYPAELAVVLLIVITVLFSVLGDLFESMLKRNVKLKDSGGMIPGHGGLLDRIDSLTAAAPIFALGSIFILKIFQ